MKDKDWLKGLENRLEDYGEPAPEGLWEDIESSIAPGGKRRLFAAPVFWRSAAVAAVLALGVFAGMRLWNPGSDVGPEVTASVKESRDLSDKNTGRKDPVEIVQSPAVASLLSELVATREHPSVGEVFKADGMAPSDLIDTEPVAGEPETVATSSGTEDDPEAVAVQRRPDDDTPSVSADYEDEDWSGYMSATADERPSRRRLSSLDVSFSGGTADRRQENSYDLQMFYRGSAPASSPGLIGGSNGAGGYGGNSGGEPDSQTRALAPMSPRNQSSAVSKSEHRRPVRLALTFNYPISRKIGLETGLTFTTLRSSFQTEAGSTVTDTEQTLMYVGVPLNMMVSIFDSRPFLFYAGVGGMAEKSVYGKTVETETLGGVRQGDGIKNYLKVKPLLWSLNASAGLQANLTGNLGIYVEPGLSYHFDDGSGVSTIYKERPLDFAVTVGARFSFK